MTSAPPTVQRHRHDGAYTAKLDRNAQLRHLFMSWLRVAGRPDERGSWGGLYLGAMLLAWPEAFLTGNVRRLELKRDPRGAAFRYPWHSKPNNIKPLLPGGPVRPDELAVVVQQLMDDGYAQWIPIRIHPQVGIAGDEPIGYRWAFVLTDSGTAIADEMCEAYRDLERIRLRRVALVRWIGEHERSERRTEPISMLDFLGSPVSIIDGVASSIIDANEAAVWLVRAGFITTGGVSTPDNPVGGLTERGFVCVDKYNCDPMETPLYTTPGPDQRITFTGPAGNVAIGSSHVVQSAGNVGDRQVDITALLRFAQAVAPALPVLGLMPEQEQAAAAIAVEIDRLAEAPTPDHPRLRALGVTLRSIVEGAATSALAAGLTSLWTG